MIPYKQSKVSSEDGTISGSCFRTVIGSICEIDPETMPHWEDMGSNWFQSFYKWLRDHGYEYFGVCSVEHPDFEHELLTYEGIDGYVYAYGTSPREYVTRGHAVIYKNGEMVHDPHPLNEGLKELKGFYYIERKKDKLE